MKTKIDKIWSLTLCAIGICTIILAVTNIIEIKLLIKEELF